MSGIDTQVCSRICSPCPPLQVAVMLTPGNKPSSQVKVMDDHKHVVV